jgi:hypothetical protein
MLVAGAQPVTLVMADLSQVPEGKIYKLFAPLIDKALSLLFGH